MYVRIYIAGHVSSYLYVRFLLVRKKVENLVE